MKNVKNLVIAALLTALTCIATMFTAFPIGTLGYIHLGDGFVLLCGTILGPSLGALAAGIGSMLADLFLGYTLWAPATLVTKALTALLCGLIYHKLTKVFKNQLVRIIIGGIVGEAFMILGYFLYGVFLSISASGSFNQATLTAGIASSSAGIPLNSLQGFVGIIITILILPIISKLKNQD